MTKGFKNTVTNTTEQARMDGRLGVFPIINSAAIPVAEKRGQEQFVASDTGGRLTVDTRYPKKDLVCCNSSFAYESAPNITHMTLDGERTACGLTAWATTEGWHSNGPDCLRCRKAWGRLPEAERRSPWEEG